jgi:hypothetical protein
VLEVGRQHLDGGVGRQPADAPDHFGEMRGAAIHQVVAVDRGDHHVLQAELLHRQGDMLRLQRIKAERPAGLDVAEAAGPGAGIAHDHHGGVPLAPALADIRAGRLLAHGVQAVLAHDPAGLEIAFRGRRLDPDPRRLAR